MKPFHFQQAIMVFTLLASVCFFSADALAQIDNDGCVGGDFGIDADIYANVLEFGDHSGAPAANTIDWFGNPGLGIIDESSPGSIMTLLQAGGNPSYERRMNSGLSSVVNGHILIDAVWSKEYFGGTGFRDPTSYTSSSKNGDDPAIWATGSSNVLGKNDLMDVAGHMRRTGTTLADDLWFYGVITRSDPGGSAYMDFEFFIEEVTYDNTKNSFSSGGPDLGHTAFEFDALGNIIATGDVIFNVSLTGGGSVPDIEFRIWVSSLDYQTTTPAGGFTWGPEFDGPFNGSPYGYASILPANPAAPCGNVNKDGEFPLAPPWGTLGTKNNNYQTSYSAFSLAEVGVNLTEFGIDNASIQGADPCQFPFSTFIVKTRASGSFTAQLKDFAGPFKWGQPFIETNIVGDPLLSCLNPEITLSAATSRTDILYFWSTVDGNITSDPNLKDITVNLPGTYTLNTTLPTGCASNSASVQVSYDPAKPFFIIPPESTSTVSCNGNDGSINLDVVGATQPYTFDWSNDGPDAVDDDPQNLNNLAPGNYIVTVTDAIGCTLTGFAKVSSRTATTITSSESNASCPGLNNGMISVSVTGKSPFEYLWSNGLETPVISNLPAGSYSLTTTDDDNCTELYSTTITEPPMFSLVAILNPESDPILNDGQIDLIPTGGTPPYTYDWDIDGPDNPDDDTQDLTGLTAGLYTVTVTDALGCFDTANFTVFEPEICNDGIDNDGDGLSDCDDADCKPATPGAITPSDPSPCAGVPGITYSITPLAGFSNYLWTVPTSATITAGQGTASITVTWNASQGGLICVQTDNFGCLSAVSCYVAAIRDVPSSPERPTVDN